MPDRTLPKPGGWNRFAIEVEDLGRLVTELRAHAVHFRDDIITRAGGRQVLIEDPSGNPIELFEPILPEAPLGSSGSEGPVTKEYAAAEGLGASSGGAGVPPAWSPAREARRDSRMQPGGRSGRIQEIC
jgi:hypothetical protein